MADKQIIGIEVSRGRVLPGWIDVNDHMNVAYYVLAFDGGVDALWDRFGITDEHIQEMKSSTFAVESHVIYRRELKLDDPFIVTAQILAFDEKRIHQFQRLYHAEGLFLAATAEWMNLHVDLVTRRVAPWPKAILEDIQKVANTQGDWPYPHEAGRQMRVPRPIFTVGGAAA
ncbi:MAG: thioesterase family protein [Gammaproteobacteria bacterium]|jgi:acyl-CoA thioester hydrolase|nr:thioesterase family protein [Gammaproteobacteria bacterium]MDH3749030.1 thioesterase family protein [Gammaproteobacteria bacterium]MDH3806409.1 thioesterase family protein [Gammaproteobacteria bacterium]